MSTQPPHMGWQAKVMVTRHGIGTPPLLLRLPGLLGAPRRGKLFFSLFKSQYSTFSILWKQEETNKLRHSGVIQRPSLLRRMWLWWLRRYHWWNVLRPIVEPGTTFMYQCGNIIEFWIRWGFLRTVSVDECRRAPFLGITWWLSQPQRRESSLDAPIGAHWMPG